ncbi:hypothetical protein IPM65_00920 [Candidatus Roizmanbacteria bacterium]|nr:MAG: hypothetical protein IPM65_00920 [Candidatus Roizmanbacteria bacterium]
MSFIPNKLLFSLFVLMVFLFIIPKAVSAQDACTQKLTSIIDEYTAKPFNDSAFKCTNSGSINDEYWNTCFENYYNVVIALQLTGLSCTTTQLTLFENQLKPIYIQKAKEWFDSIPLTPVTNVLTPRPEITPSADTIGNFEKQLEMTVCGLEEGGACCLGGVAIDMQAPPDFSDPTLAKKNNWFTNLFSEETKQKIIGLFTGGINPAEELTSSMDMCTGTINGEDGQEVPLVPNPYRVTVDDEGNVVGTREAITKKEELDEIWDWIKPAQNAVPSAKTEAWEEAREKFRQGFGDGKSVACYCEVPETSVEGVTSGGEVRGVTVNPDDYPYGTRWNPARGMNVRSAFESNYCAKLTDEEIEKRFGYDSTGMDALNRGDECSKVMADTYFKAHEICKSIKDVKDSDGNYDKEEFAKCFDCMMDKDGVWTAFGCMYSDFSKTLNERVFGLAISFAGMIALGCIIYASFLMQTSAGNPERTGKAQELMTACITGLIVIIFSIFILRVIGVDILRLPGFVGPTPTPTPRPSLPADRI